MNYMKHLFYILMALLTCGTLTGCLGGNSVEDEYKDWREANDAWYAQQAASGYYTTAVASWDPSAQVLIHWYNDTSLTKDNLKPLYTSTVDVKYRGQLYNATPFDSSYLRVSPADSVFRTNLNGSVIEGWAIGLMRMHVGDSCRIVVPYHQGYGSNKMSDVVVPYSMLVFDIKLVDIYGYRKN